MKTIFAPKAVIDKWLTALRSGEYRQGTGELCKKDGAYCCLGVLEHCLTGETERGAILPSNEWLAQHNIRFLVKDGGFGDGAPFLPSLDCAAWEANDIKGHSFASIADAIEECAEYTDSPTSSVDAV